MLPRFISILNKHITTIKQWRRPMMRSIHHLLTTLLFAEGYFTSYLNTKSLRSLINHLLRLMNESILIDKIQKVSHNVETLIIEVALRILNMFVDVDSRMSKIN